MASGALPWKETQGSVAGSFVLQIATFVNDPFFVLAPNLSDKPYGDYQLRQQRLWCYGPTVLTSF